MALKPVPSSHEERCRQLGVLTPEAFPWCRRPAVASTDYNLVDFTAWLLGRFKEGLPAGDREHVSGNNSAAVYIATDVLVQLMSVVSGKATRETASKRMEKNAGNVKVGGASLLLDPRHPMMFKAEPIPKSLLSSATTSAIKSSAAMNFKCGGKVGSSITADFFQEWAMGLKWTAAHDRTAKWFLEVCERRPRLRTLVDRHLPEFADEQAGAFRELLLERRETIAGLMDVEKVINELLEAWVDFRTEELSPSDAKGIDWVIAAVCKECGLSADDAHTLDLDELYTRVLKPIEKSKRDVGRRLAVLENRLWPLLLENKDLHELDRLKKKLLGLDVVLHDSDLTGVLLCDMAAFLRRGGDLGKMKKRLYLSGERPEEGGIDALGLR